MRERVQILQAQDLTGNDEQLFYRHFVRGPHQFFWVNERGRMTPKIGSQVITVREGSYLSLPLLKIEEGSKKTKSLLSWAMKCLRTELLDSRKIVDMTYFFLEAQEGAGIITRKEKKPHLYMTAVAAVSLAVR